MYLSVRWHVLILILHRLSLTQVCFGRLIALLSMLIENMPQPENRRYSPLAVSLRPVLKEVTYAKRFL